MKREFHSRWFVTILICAVVSPLAWGDLLVSPLAIEHHDVRSDPERHDMARGWHGQGRSPNDSGRRECGGRR